MPSYDPTTVLSRKLQSEAKRAHKIKLQKQLDKALKIDGDININNTTINTSDFPSKRREKIENSSKATKSFSQHSSKPNPIHNALIQKDIKQKEKDEIRLLNQKQKEERERNREKSQKERERIKRKLQSTSKSGQPKLSNHIDVLLGKIVKNTPGAQNYMAKHKKILRKEKKEIKKKQFTNL